MIKTRKTLVALGFGLALVVVGLAAFSSSASSVTAQTKEESKQTSEPVASPTGTRTPALIRLRPWVQFGRAEPGGVARYTKLLFNRLEEETRVRLFAHSLQGWHIRVDPTSTLAIPGYANVIHYGVRVPEEPDRRIDIERAVAVISDTRPISTTAYMITIVRRHRFTDLEEDHWADGPVQHLLDQGVIGGYGDGSFRPNDNVTRAQFAKMLVTAMGWEVQTPATPTFSDVPADFWAYGYVETAAAHGVITGYADGSFRPAASITRAQMAKMIYTGRGWTLETATRPNFGDVSEGDWHYAYVQAASSAEVMSGYGDNTFRPNAPATRAQVAKILALSLFSDPNN